MGSEPTKKRIVGSKPLLDVAIHVTGSELNPIYNVEVTLSSLAEYLKSLDIEHSKMRFRRRTGSQYRAKIQYLDRDSEDLRWGMFILPRDTQLTYRNINFPRPRQPRKKSLSDPSVATRITQIGDVKLDGTYEIYLVK